eukprot:IDg17767t1
METSLPKFQVRMPAEMWRAPREDLIELAREVQKFNKSLIEVEGWKPTGVDEGNIFCIASHVACKVLHTIAKFEPRVLATPPAREAANVATCSGTQRAPRDAPEMAVAAQLLDDEDEGSGCSGNPTRDNAGSTTRATLVRRKPGERRASKDSADRAYRDRQR